MRTIVWVLIALAILAGGFYIVNDFMRDEPQTPGESSDRYMDIETYVRTNIGELSPTPAVLGGTFYVTKIEATDGRGVVEYEDGHIALVADFTYVVEELGKPVIKTFTVREQ